ncbi:hypothetical protein AB0E67_34270 [Streptomyces sp. NPDC032161]|uniref:hypothetical protein n=1 Tax=unclassified Streptomyces TaxID=2593676 RepID=UPI0033FCAF68
MDPAEVRQRVGELRSKYEATIELARQRRAATAPADPSRTPLGHGQEQSAAHQQHRSQGTGRT